MKEKYFKIEYSPKGILFNVNATGYFKFKLQLKFGKNEHYSSTILNFHTGLLYTIH